MLNGYADCVKEDQHNHKPIKPLLFDCMSNFKTRQKKIEVSTWIFKTIIEEKKQEYRNRFSALQNLLQAPLFFTLDLR